jgi:hypothetical protein
MPIAKLQLHSRELKVTQSELQTLELTHRFLKVKGRVFKKAVHLLLKK